MKYENFGAIVVLIHFFKNLKNMILNEETNALNLLSILFKIFFSVICILFLTDLIFLRDVTCLIQILDKPVDYCKTNTFNGILLSIVACAPKFSLCHFRNKTARIKWHICISRPVKPRILSPRFIKVSAEGESQKFHCVSRYGTVCNERARYRAGWCVSGKRFPTHRFRNFAAEIKLRE